MSLALKYRCDVNMRKQIVDKWIKTPTCIPLVVIAYGIEMIPPPIIELIMLSAASRTVKPSY